MNNIISPRKSILILAMIALFSSIFTSSCRKEDFDEPPLSGADPNLTANITIKALKDSFRFQIVSQNKIIPITEDWIIRGVVTGDDKTGNFYKTIVIEDETAGISIRIDMTNFYVDYPVGRRVFVKLKGLYLADYGDLLQLGGWIDSSGTTPSVEPIPLSLVDDYLIGGVSNLNPQPKKVTMADLAQLDSFENRFIEIIDTCEFDAADTSKPYADAVLLQSINRTVNSCIGGSIVVRTSGYCNFANALTPSSKGIIKGIFTRFGSTPQLVIRDTTDVNMNTNRRCGDFTDPLSRATISTVRAIFSGSTTNINSNYFITGVVISDRNGANLNSRNVFIQDETAGICVRFSANHTLNIGDSISVLVAGQSIGEFSNLLQIGTSTPNVPLANATVLATGKTVSPRIATVADILSNMAANDSWEGSLLKINNATITGGATYAGSVQITDATGVMTLYTASAASFSGTALPTGTVSITGILSDYGGNITPPNTNAQLLLRNAADVQ